MAAYEFSSTSTVFTMDMSVPTAFVEDDVPLGEHPVDPLVVLPEHVLGTDREKEAVRMARHAIIRSMVNEKTERIVGQVNRRLSEDDPLEVEVSLY